MLLATVTAAGIMGLLGGPHCAAMCAAPCHGIVQGHQQAVLRQQGTLRRWHGSLLQFHAGRGLGYAALGALAAQAMEQVAWLSDQTSWLYRVWVLLHLAVLAWGLLVLLQGQQPAWLERAGRQAWQRVQPLVAGRAGAGVAGVMWACMPCGLLYSALMVAALSGSAVAGALSMLAFAAAGALWLLAAPLLWRWLQGRAAQLRAQWGPRAAGAMLVAVALWALWRDLVHVPAQWCR